LTQMVIEDSESEKQQQMLCQMSLKLEESDGVIIMEMIRRIPVDIVKTAMRIGTMNARTIIVIPVVTIIQETVNVGEVILLSTIEAEDTMVMILMTGTIAIVTNMMIAQDEVKIITTTTTNTAEKNAGTVEAHLLFISQVEAAMDGVKRVYMMIKVLVREEMEEVTPWILAMNISNQNNLPVAQRD